MGQVREVEGLGSDEAVYGGPSGGEGRGWGFGGERGGGGGGYRGTVVGGLGGAVRELRRKNELGRNALSYALRKGAEEEVVMLMLDLVRGRGERA